MDASYNEDVERVEAVFARELPAIKERMPQIIDGPWYKGIDGFSQAGVSYNFAFTTKAEYRFQATRDFKREIYKMFVDNDIIVPFNQVTVNPADPKDRPKASDEEKKTSASVLAKNRAKKSGKTKEKLSTKISKAYKATVEEFKD
jgi:small conductance mechanosensitive channel